MIDKSGEYWRGSSADDIDEYLAEYSEEPDIEVKSVVCHSCQNNVFQIFVDYDECAIKLKCTKCKAEKALLDSEEVLPEANPELQRCPVCKFSSKHNVKVGFHRRKNGDIKWVYIGNRCFHCRVLGSYLDMKIDYGPTDEMEKNI